MLLSTRVTRWYEHHARDLPWRHDDATPWGILVSEFMLQQTQVSRVQPVWREWMLRWPTPAALAEASPADVLRAWGRLGYPRRALRLLDCARIIVTDHGGEVPGTAEQLLALPGVGDYTARAVAVFAFGRREVVVDTNIRRVLARSVLGTAQADRPSFARDMSTMAAVLPRRTADVKTCSLGIMELGALVCTAASPKCEACPLAPICAWRAAGCPEDDHSVRSAATRFAGSHREARGTVLAALRASARPLAVDQATIGIADLTLAAQAVDSLLADGLVVTEEGALALPGSLPPVPRTSSRRGTRPREA